MTRKFNKLDKVKIVGGRGVGMVGVVTNVVKWHDRYGYVVENHYHKPQQLGTYHACNLIHIPTEEFIDSIHRV